ncbi:MAG: HAD-IIA family hydrolase [Candidatus Aenigmatarchaeota archaeon]
MNLKKFNTFIFDLDGTFWNFPQINEGCREVYEKLEKLKKKVIFVSNFTYLDRDGIIKIFKDSGIKIEKEQLITSGYVASLILKNKKVFPIGDGLKRELLKNGIKLSEKYAEAVVVGHDTKYNYYKASKALNLLLKGANFYTTAEGKIWFFRNKTVPGTGIIVAGLEFCSNKKAVMLGKPSIYILKEIKKKVKGKIIYFGDEVKADVEFAKKAGFFSVFVRSGVDRNVKKHKADFVLNSVGELLKFLR